MTSLACMRDPSMDGLCLCLVSGRAVKVAAPTDPSTCPSALRCVLLLRLRCLQEHWEKFVGLFEKTLIQLEREIPEETREAAKRSIHATKHYFVPIGQETEYTNSSIVALPTDAA